MEIIKNLKYLQKYSKDLSESKTIELDKEHHYHIHTKQGANIDELIIDFDNIGVDIKIDARYVRALFENEECYYEDDPSCTEEDLVLDYAEFPVTFYDKEFNLFHPFTIDVLFHFEKSELGNYFLEFEEGELDLYLNHIQDISIKTDVSSAEEELFVVLIDAMASYKLCCRQYEIIY